MKNKKVMAAVAAVGLILIIYAISSRSGGDMSADNIIGSDQKISAQDIHLNLQSIQFDNSDIGKFFSNRDHHPIHHQVFQVPPAALS